MRCTGTAALMMRLGAASMDGGWTYVPQMTGLAIARTTCVKVRNYHCTFDLSLHKFTEMLQIVLLE